MFRLGRNFAISGAIVSVLTVAALVMAYRYFAEMNLTHSTEISSVARSQALARDIWKDVPDYPDQIRSYRRDNLLVDPSFSVIADTVTAHMQNTAILKAHVFDLNGVILFSTDQRQIGLDKSSYPGIQHVLAQHTPISNLSFRDSIDAFEKGAIANVHTVATYIPVFDNLGDVKFIIEFYVDVSFLYDRIIDQTVLLGISFSVICLLGYLAILFFARYADRTIARQYREILDDRERLRQSEERFGITFQKSPGMVAIIDPETNRHLDVNEAWCRLLAIPKEEAIGRTAFELGIWKDRDDRARVMDGLKQNGTIKDIEAGFCSRDGKVHDVYVSADEVVMDGQPRIIFTIQDVTLMKHAERVLRDKGEELERRVEERTRELRLIQDDLISAKEDAENANRAKSQFLSSMSHELRTPMNAIIGFSEMMVYDQSTELPEKHREYLSYILSSASHLMSLINQVLELSRIESGVIDIEPEVFSLEPYVKGSMELMGDAALKKNVTVRMACACNSDIEVWADPVRFKQVLFNILSNAVKYNRDGGEIEVTCQQTDDGRAMVVVADTGVGIAPDKRDQVFQPFNRLGLEAQNIEGTGIGLTITKDLVERMGGEIGFESAIGTGTRFWVTLPAKPPAAKVGLSGGVG